MIKKCLKPWVDENTRVLIVGTMPSEQSLAKQTYYANPKNKFWTYISKILDNEQLLTMPDRRKEILLTHRVGLWDALDVCERKGSLDLHIKNAVVNDFSELTNIEHFLFNGQKAFKWCNQKNEHIINNRYTILPSTSPANTSATDEEKFVIWKDALLRVLK